MGLEGGLNTAVGYVVFAFLWALLGNRWHYLSILAVTYGLVMIFGFFIYRELVFRSETPWVNAASKYVTVVLGSVAINSVALVVLIEHFHFPVLLSQAVGIFLAATFSFVAHKYWTFRPKRPRDSHPGTIAP